MGSDGCWKETGVGGAEMVGWGTRNDGVAEGRKRDGWGAEWVGVLVGRRGMVRSEINLPFPLIKMGKSVIFAAVTTRCTFFFI